MKYERLRGQIWTLVRMARCCQRGGGDLMVVRSSHLKSSLEVDLVTEGGDEWR